MSLLSNIFTPGSSENEDIAWRKYCRKQDEQYYRQIGRKAVKHGLTRFILQVEPLTKHHSEVHDDNVLTKDSVTRNPEHARTFSLIKEFFRNELNLHIVEGWERELLEDAKKHGVDYGDECDES